jgi:indolepyruvate ferredoxin oxidoreductase beta subunit
LGNAILSCNFDVKVSEVHGMSQRGGSVVTYVKYGDKVYSPIIDKGEADIILAFEQLEALRALPYLKIGGKMIANTQKINPMPVITGAAKYPEAILDTIGASVDLTALDALSIAQEAGNAKAVNVVLVGVMAKNTDIPYETWVQAVRECVPAKFLEANLRAFDAGYRYGSEA